jgi:signal transduction histidine kinase
VRLAPRLVIAFGLVATLSVVGLGYVVREDRRASETRRFEREVASACERVVAEIERQGESDRKLVAGACQSGELVDRALIWSEGHPLDGERRLALSRLVPEERQAFDLDELALADGDGDLLGEDPAAHIGAARAEISALATGDTAHSSLRLTPEPALVARCRKLGAGGKTIALVGARHLTGVVDRLSQTLDVHASLGEAPPRRDDVATASCALHDASGAALAISIAKPKSELVENLARIDQTVLYAGLMSTGLALVLAVLLARSLGRPIAELASEARKVASGQARPLRVGGAGEIAELAQAFDTMLTDLEATRRRLAASTRVAAWREVARQVAHEIKNPLMPIRAAVETLRRLRARDDPAFDGYFEEATRTVLAEVHRIADIVTEFTRFARMSPPQPAPVDVVDVARHVVRLHETTVGGTHLTLRVEGKPPPVLADRDQIVQVLTNLVQNALDAVAAAPEGPGGRDVSVTVAAAPPAHVSVTVADNGPGVPADFAPRLFEPYATTKAHGTGLGLAIAQRIAMEHDGELSYAAGSGGGATFRLLLPEQGPPRAAS